MSTLSRHFWILLALVMLVLSGCSKDEEKGDGGGSEEPEKPKAKDNKRQPPPANRKGAGGDNAAKTAKTKSSTNPRTVKTSGKKPANTGNTKGKTPRPKAGKTPRKQPNAGRVMPVEHLFDDLKNDIRTSTGYGEFLGDAPFPGLSPSKKYNALRFETESNGFGVGFQIWRPGSPQGATKRYNTLYEQSVGGKTANLAGVQSAFFTTHHKLHTLTVMNRNVVTAITCEAKICSKEQLGQLAQLAIKRIN